LAMACGLWFARRPTRTLSRCVRQWPGGSGASRCGSGATRCGLARGACRCFVWRNWSCIERVVTFCKKKKKKKKKKMAVAGCQLTVSSGSGPAVVGTNRSGLSRGAFWHFIWRNWSYIERVVALCEGKKMVVAGWQWDPIFDGCLNRGPAQFSSMPHCADAFYQSQPYPLAYTAIATLFS
jgi:hypothetical protein